MPSENQNTINERIKFLIDKLGMSIRGFSSELGVSDTNTRNYIDRGSKPNSDYLQKLLRRFDTINPTWLLLGEGEPFIPATHENIPTTANNQKFFRSQVIGENQGIANQNKNSNSAEIDSLKNQLLLAEKDIESLRTQVAMQAALLASKDETITLLRASYNRPN